MQFQLVQSEISVVQILHLNDRDLYNYLKSQTRPEENQTTPRDFLITRREGFEIEASK
jgi:hypothetical protein